MNNNLNPIFNELHRLPWDGSSPLLVEVKDYDGQDASEPLGNLIISLSDFDFSSGKPFVVKDRRLDNIQTGMIDRREVMNSYNCLLTALALFSLPSFLSSFLCREDISGNHLQSVDSWSSRSSGSASAPEK